jgi:hypothetical protein
VANQHRQRQTRPGSPPGSDDVELVAPMSRGLTRPPWHTTRVRICQSAHVEARATPDLTRLELQVLPAGSPGQLTRLRYGTRRPRYRGVIAGARAGGDSTGRSKGSSPSTPSALHSDTLSFFPGLTHALTQPPNALTRMRAPPGGAGACA